MPQFERDHLAPARPPLAQLAYGPPLAEVAGPPRRVEVGSAQRVCEIAGESRHSSGIEPRDAVEDGPCPGPAHRCDLADGRAGDQEVDVFLLLLWCVPLLQLL